MSTKTSRNRWRINARSMLKKVNTRNITNHSGAERDGFRCQHGSKKEANASQGECENGRIGVWGGENVEMWACEKRNTSIRWCRQIIPYHIVIFYTNIIVFFNGYRHMQRTPQMTKYVKHFKAFNGIRLWGEPLEMYMQANSNNERHLKLQNSQDGQITF